MAINNHEILGMAILVLILASSLFINLVVKASAKVIIVPDDYSTIQQAIDASSPGDTIIVRRGIYFENIDITNKHDIVIKAVDGAENTIVIAKLGTDPVFKIENSSDITISGFTIAKALSYKAGGILVVGSRNVKLVGNMIVDSMVGVWIDYSSNVLVENITTARNSYGVRIRYSLNTTVCCSNIVSNYIGMEIIDSKNLIVFLNNFVKNTRDVYALRVSDAKWYKEGLGGNYWSNTTGYRGSIYVIDNENIDPYPLPSPRISIPVAIPIIYIVTSTIVIQKGGLEATYLVVIIVIAIMVIAILYVYAKRGSRKAKAVAIKSYKKR